MFDQFRESAITLGMGVGATQLPGPTKDEWTGVIFGVVMLAVRELLAYIGRRRA